MLAAKALKTLVATNNTSDQDPICKVIYGSSDPKSWSSSATYRSSGQCIPRRHSSRGNRRPGFLT